MDGKTVAEILLIAVGVYALIAVVMSISCLAALWPRSLLGMYRFRAYRRDKQ